ncbi:unnamed protein product, partial [marine sediment metagenome]
ISPLLTRNIKIKARIKKKELTKNSVVIPSASVIKPTRKGPKIAAIKLKK